MKNLNFPVRKDNFGGVDHFYFVREEDIADQDENGLVILKEDAAWNLGRCTKYTLDFVNPSKDTRAGTTFIPRLTGIISKHTPELEEVLIQMRENRFVIIYKDKNGYLNQVGRIDETLTFTTEQISGDMPSAKNGVRIVFTGSTKNPPVKYALEIITTPGEPGLENNGLPVLIYINGNLVATVPAGGRYDINTEFTLEYAIL